MCSLYSNKEFNLLKLILKNLVRVVSKAPFSSRVFTSENNNYLRLTSFCSDNSASLV